MNFANKFAYIKKKSYLCSRKTAKHKNKYQYECFYYNELQQ